jgi:hypothetical protein
MVLVSLVISMDMVSCPAIMELVY